jgi:hypothetical protein
MPKVIVVVGFFVLSFASFAQISTPTKRKFNIGVSVGLMIWKEKPMAALDLSYKGTTLRIMPNYRYNSVGITQELMKLSPAYYNLYWTASVYGAYGYLYDAKLPVSSIDTYNPQNEYKRMTYTGIATTGLKTYFAKRMYANVMGGVMYSKSMGGTNYGVANSTEVKPYLECTLGILLYKTYPKLKPEETQE